VPTGCARSSRARPGAETYWDRGTLTCAYSTYWSGVPGDEVELYPPPGRFMVAAPTNDGKLLTIVLWPNAAFDEVRSGHRGALHALARAGARSRRADPRRHAQRALPRHEAAPEPPPPRLRRRWALVGDAGYHKDPILALGIGDAFRDAELLARAVHGGLAGCVSLADALAG
jgi:2-polyprenyl-6-methoxyphenol hydroxylase-like FAD-dependent oxidoreductase